MKKVSTILAAFSLLLVGTAFSHSGATGIVKERMDAMGDMGDKSKIVADMFKGKSVFQKSAITDAAYAFSMHGSRMLELFPDTKESRTGSETEALPLIWEQWDDFNAMVTEFIARSEALHNAVAASDDARELKIAFFQTTKSCSGCHKRYRKPKD